MTTELQTITAATEAGVVAELATDAATSGQVIRVADPSQLHRPHITVDRAGHPVLLDLRGWAPPAFVATHVAFTESASFVTYVERMRTPHMLLRAHVTDGRVRATFDYHADPDTPGRCENLADFVMAKSHPWQQWSAMSGELMPQDRFAEFLTDRRGEVIDPDAATMVELAQTFQAHTEVTFRSRVSLASGAVQFMYDENSTGQGVTNTGSIPVPESIRLRMPIVEGGDVVELTARLRWRTDRNGLRLGYVIENQTEVWRDAFNYECGAIAAATGTDILR